MLRLLVLMCGLLTTASATPERAAESAPAERRPVIAVPVQPAPPKWLGEPVSLSLREADLAEVLSSLARIGGFNLVLDPSVAGKVTVELHDVPLHQALSVILKTHRLGLEVSGSVVAVAPRPRAVVGTATGPTRTFP